MAKGDDAVRKKANKANRKKQNKKESSSVSSRVAAIIAAKKRRQSGKRRNCQVLELLMEECERDKNLELNISSEGAVTSGLSLPFSLPMCETITEASGGMCFSLPTPENPFNDKHEKMDFKGKETKKLVPSKADPLASPTSSKVPNTEARLVVQLIPTAAALISYGLHVFQKHGVEFPFAAIQPRGPHRAPPREAPVDDDTKERFPRSEYFLSKEEMEEVAHGLELSKLNFIWVVRFPFVEKIELQEALPKGFLDRKERTRCGGLGSPGPNSGPFKHWWQLPMKYDQPMNGRLVEDVGVAVEVKRDENGKLNREEIAQVIRKVVVEKDGVDMRIKAREFSERMRMKGQDEIDWVVEELVQLCNEAKLLKN
ncbi:P-loop containing nucleoside triphosphate hydrolases superfamily protein [Actinidia rufa]|uniref:P-loop containing nucleoside triphosphate hydrolases superfamily protein n=1 Tax=Actinidia rufa TaxID=165716 RepID=A0A7J0DVF4_9ERIC|nr:P-loop containing nucleoside triphosphate hydrolases superfamily protein [Actinidia rufa]